MPTRPLLGTAGDDAGIIGLAHHLASAAFQHGDGWGWDEAAPTSDAWDYAHDVVLREHEGLLFADVEFFGNAPDEGRALVTARATVTCKPGCPYTASLVLDVHHADGSITRFYGPLVNPTVTTEQCHSIYHAALDPDMLAVVVARIQEVVAEMGG
jgi:hypothetical protein